MDPAVELYVLTAGGLLEPNAEWTEAARGHVATALGEELRIYVVQTPYFQSREGYGTSRARTF